MANGDGGYIFLRILNIKAAAPKLKRGLRGFGVHSPPPFFFFLLLLFVAVPLVLRRTERATRGARFNPISAHQLTATFAFGASTRATCP